MYTAIHVDDDKRSLDLMNIAIQNLSSIELKGSFISGDEALKWLDKHSVDIIFLDIEMPGKNGLEIAQEISNRNSDVIFVTAHAGFAIKAFEACALDYLLKPIYAEKLNHAIERYTIRKQKLAGPSGEKRGGIIQEQVNELLTNYINSESYPKRIFINMIGETRVLNLDNILYFEASGPYTRIILTSGEIVTCSESIKSYSESLQNHPDYLRIHRSYLVNKKFITSIPRKHNNVSVKMDNGEVLPIAQQRRNEIMQQIIG